MATPVTLQQVLNAKSIKDIMTFNYCSVPIIALDGTRGIHMAYIVFNATTYNYELKYTTLRKDQECADLIFFKITGDGDRGQILRFNALPGYPKGPLGYAEPDWEFLDSKFLQPIKDHFQKVSQIDPAYVIFKLDTPQEIKEAIIDAERFGGYKTFSLNGRTRMGYLVVIEYDPYDNEYRAYANDGYNYYDFTEFPKEALIPNTLYVVCDLTRKGDIYKINDTADLSFSTKY